MIKLSVMTSALSLVASSSLAGNILSPDPSPDVAQPASESVDWSGGFIGATAGYTWSNADGGLTSTTVGKIPVTTTKILIPVTTTKILDSNPDGLSFGIHAGYRWQREDVVQGLELGYVSYSLEQEGFELNDSITIRGMLGKDYSDTLLFLSAGLTNSNIQIGNGISDRRWGYNFGLGLERMITDHISLRAEVTHTVVNDLSPGEGSVSANIDLDYTDFRVGFNYNF